MDQPSKTNHKLAGEGYLGLLLLLRKLGEEDCLGQVNRVNHRLEEGYLALLLLLLLRKLGVDYLGQLSNKVNRQGLGDCSVRQLRRSRREAFLVVWVNSNLSSSRVEDCLAVVLEQVRRNNSNLRVVGYSVHQLLRNRRGVFLVVWVNSNSNLSRVEDCSAVVLEQVQRSNSNRSSNSNRVSLGDPCWATSSNKDSSRPS